MTTTALARSSNGICWGGHTIVASVDGEEFGQPTMRRVSILPSLSYKPQNAFLELSGVAGPEDFPVAEDGGHPLFVLALLCVWGKKNFHRSWVNR